MKIMNLKVTNLDNCQIIFTQPILAIDKQK